MSISEQTREAIQQQTIQYWTASYRISARSRLHLLRRYKDQYDWIEREFANICGNLSWLATQHDLEEAVCFLEYIQLLFPYMQKRDLQTDLLQWCRAGLYTAEIFQQNTGWLFFLCGQAHYALGQWDEARTSFQTAIKRSETEDVQTHARATLSLGRLEFNQGNYTAAFRAMNTAKAFFTQEADQEQLLIILGEAAAYHLNRREFNKALSLYQEIDRLQKQSGTMESSDHTLLMLGVVYRRKKEYQRACAYLQQLIERGERQKNRAAVATASHHLAWVYLNRNELSFARKLCGRAIMLYEEIGDERGLGSTYEQLGCIALAENQGSEALLSLEKSLLLKRQRHNQQGEASVLRHLAIAHLTIGHLQASVECFWKSLVLYQRLGVLTIQRISNVFWEYLTWAMGQRRWKK